MESNYKLYQLVKSLERIDTILSRSNDPLEEANSIPSRDKLTYSNGFYVNCSALFADIRGSSDLTDQHRRPKLAKLYRSFLSEAVAIVNGDQFCAEVNIVGDCVSAIFDAQYKSHIDAVFCTAAQVSSLIKILNCKFRKAGIAEIEVGIGLAYGRALMVQAGLTGSGINNVVWMGDVVNEASNLCAKAYTNSAGPMVVSGDFYSNLCEDYQRLLTKQPFQFYYSGDVVNMAMEEWWNNNCT